MQTNKPKNKKRSFLDSKLITIFDKVLKENNRRIK
jgi:hypothetical protein